MRGGEGTMERDYEVRDCELFDLRLQCPHVPTFPTSPHVLHDVLHDVPYDVLQETRPRVPPASAPRVPRIVILLSKFYID
jgi:hypothetical protein